MTPGRDQFICTDCGEPADEDEAPAYCPHCGWDGIACAFENDDGELEIKEREAA